MALNQAFPGHYGFDLPFVAQIRKVFGPEPDMANLIVKDSFEDAGGSFVASRAESLDRNRRYIQRTRFQNHRHHGQPGGDIVRGRFCRFPHPSCAGISP